MINWTDPPTEFKGDKLHVLVLDEDVYSAPARPRQGAHEKSTRRTILWRLKNIEGKNAAAVDVDAQSQATRGEVDLVFDEMDGQSRRANWNQRLAVGALVGGLGIGAIVAGLACRLTQEGDDGVRR